MSGQRRMRARSRAASRAALRLLAVDSSQAVTRQGEDLVESAQLHARDVGVVIGHVVQEPDIFLDRRADLPADEPGEARGNPADAGPARMQMTEGDHDGAAAVDRNEIVIEVV